MPVDVLKIDQTFVRDMLNDRDDLAIVESVIGLASAFHRNVIAEGVETAAHGVQLLAMGCEQTQGYGIARPMPASGIPAWIKIWRPDSSWKTASSSNERVLKHAEMDHQKWLFELEKYLSGENNAAPAMNEKECRLGNWLHHEGLLDYFQDKRFIKVMSVHGQVHEVARELVDMSINGQHMDVQEKLERLHALSDELITSLRALLSTSEV